MIFRLLYRLLRQRLDREGAGAPPETATDAFRRLPAGRVSGSRPRRRRATVTAIVTGCVLGAVALAVAVLPFHLPAPRTAADGASATLHLRIPAVDAAPMVVYLRGAGLDPPPPPGETPSPAYRIRSAAGRFSPRFQVVPAASTVEMTNADSIAHNTHVFNRGETVFNVALPLQGVAVRKMLAGDGIFEVRCDMHPWMKAWMFVSPSRHYAVVGEPTTVSFTGIAPGEYILHHWQPDRAESIHPLRLAAHETRRLRLR